MTAPLEHWRDEMRSALLYRVLAETEKGTSREALFADLARAAEAQGAIWAEAVRRGGEALPSLAPGLRVRIAAFLIRRFGPRRIRPVLAAMKVRGLSVYSGKAPGHEMPTTIEDVGARHTGAGSGGNLRAAVFGVNDGLVSNASLILGVAGASSQSDVILLSGVAGLLAGAFSMAAGEYISVRSQRELFESQIGLERDELAEYPKEEAAELALIYAARGIPKQEAQALAERIIADPARALDTPGARRARAEPRRAGLPGRCGRVLVRFVRDRRIDSAGAVPVPGGQPRAVPRGRARRPLALRRGRDAEPVHGRARALGRSSDAAARRRRGRSHVRASGDCWG